MQSHRILNIPSPNLPLANLLSKKLNISTLFAQVLINRGLESAEAAEGFLNIGLGNLLDPYSFADMHKAVDVIRKALKNKSGVMVFGDYDVDGITAVALLKNTLSKIGIKPLHYIPHRIKEGYGLNKNILSIAKENKIKLLITVDCGTNSHREVEELRRHAIEVIVTDHHEPLDKKELPATAVINPKLESSRYGYRDLAGVGVAYKLCQAITGNKLSEELDLVCLGTIADVVPLTGENRIIVKDGLSRITKTKKAGLKALMEVSGIKDKEVTPIFVSYILGPRINASGRMDTAETALKLLMSSQKQEAHELAGALQGYNRQRQKIESRILDEAEGLINQEVNFKEHKIIVIAKDDWHQGVLGIVASKLADRFYRPTILISKGAQSCKGSGRSIKNFHLFHALLECKDLLQSFGGHSHAAGMVIAKENIEGFRDKINSLAKERLRLEDLIPTLDIDMELNLADLNETFIEELAALRPFGTGNPEPAFFTRRLKLKGEPRILSNYTLKFWITDGTFTYSAIGFGLSSLKDALLKAAHFDLVYTPRIDNWGGKEEVVLEIKDIFFDRH